MDLVKPFILLILISSYIIGYYITYFSRDEIKKSKKPLLLIKLIIHLLLIIILIFIVLPLDLLKILLIIFGIIISFFYFNPFILSLGLIGISINSELSLIYISVLLLYFLTHGITSFIFKKMQLKNKLNMIIILSIVLLTFSLEKNLEIILPLLLGYSINIKNLFINLEFNKELNL